MTSTNTAVELWKRRLWPFKALISLFWVAISFQSSVTISLGVYAGVLCVIFISPWLLVGTLIQSIGLLLLFISICYGILTVAVNSQIFILANTTPSCDQDDILFAVSSYVAIMEHNSLCLMENVVKLRSKQPVMFYVGGGILVILLGWLGQLMSVFTMTWISIVLLLTVPYAMAKGWISASAFNKLLLLFEQTISRAQHTFYQECAKHAIHIRKYNTQK